MSQFRLTVAWTEPESDGQWVATGEAFPGAPVMHLWVYQLEDTRWAYEVWYAYDPGEKWIQDGFQSREGAQASAELKVDRLQGGGGR